MEKTLLNRTDVVKFLWQAVENTHKAIKALYDNPVYSGNNLWDELFGNLRRLRSVRNLKPGSYYKIDTFKERYSIIRLEGYEVSLGQDGVDARVRVLTAVESKILWTETQDEMLLSINEISSNDELNSDDLTTDKLLLMMGNAFKGSLFEEMIKKEESHE